MYTWLITFTAMNGGQWLVSFKEQVAATTLLEWIAVIAAVVQVLLARANNVWLYPAGIISTVLYIYIMSNAGLYAESLLNGYYLVMSVYGWMHWLRKKDRHELPITHTSTSEWGITTGIVIIGWALMWWVLDTYTDSNVPAWDAWISATAWAGMWLLARRKLENWILLNVSNLFAIPLLIYKGLPLTACLTIFLFIVAIFGYIQWRKLHREQKVAF